MERYLLKQNKKIKYFLLLLIGFLLISCSDHAIYHQYQSIEDITWEKDKEYYFTFYIEDASIPYNIHFDVRNNNLYPYQNLWIFYNIEQPIGPILHDTMECMLADDFGKWNGKGISLFQTRFPLKTNYKFRDAGQYTFSFRQGMRNDTLRGIQDIGLFIEKVK